MKSHNWLLEALLRDCGIQCSVPPIEINRDIRTISNRVVAEGLSFLMITLPSFDSVFLRALSDGRLPSAGFPGFRSVRGFPSFMRGFLRRVFDTTGRLLDEPDITAVACIHQVCLTFKKVEADCSDARVAAAMKSFIEIDRDLPDLPEQVRLGTSIEGVFAPPVAELSQLFRVLFWEALKPLDRMIWEGEPLNARHGPGATAERVKFNDKYRWTQWTERLSKVFNSDQYLHALENCSLETPSNVHVPLEAIAPEQETPVRVIPVPKTLKSPRIIAIEPVTMQFMQQGLLDGITKGIRSTFIGASCLFDDQSVNAKRALEGSKDGHNATLDLSEASDRVGFKLVESLVRPWLPSLMEALDATRSRHAQVPTPDPFRGCRRTACDPHHLSGVSPSRRGGGLVREEPRPSNEGPGSSRHGRHDLGRLDIPPVSGRRLGSSADVPFGVSCRKSKPPGRVTITLRKFASMGSAVCFPVEAMVFTTIAFAGVLRSSNLPFTPRSARLVSRQISVFGDDIVVPRAAAPTVAAFLEAYGLKVNYRKSFWEGNFRESCGTDAFKGVDVTPAYLKTLSWGDRGTLGWLAQWVEFSNTLYMKGFWETSRTVRKRIALLGYRIPMVSATSPAIGYHNVRGSYEVESWCTFTHAPRVKAYQFRSGRVDSPLDGVAALRKCLAPGRAPASFDNGVRYLDPEHLRSALKRSASVSTKRRWLSPF